MKRVLCALLLTLGLLHATAQNIYNSSGKSNGYKQKKIKGYDPDKLVLGGGVNFGYSGDYANFGITPKVGYKLNNYLVVGASLGYQYFMVPYEYLINNKVNYIHENIVSPGLWVKAPLFNLLVLSADFDFNFINVRSYNTYYDQNGNVSLRKAIYNVTAPTLLVGGGIKQSLGGRTSAIGEIMYDIIQNEYSPYRQQLVYRVGIYVGL